MKRLTADEKKKLSDQITDMIITGYSYKEIAHKLGINQRTVTRYVKSRRQEILEELNIAPDQHIASLEVDQAKRIKRLWTIALDEKQKAGDRNKAIALLQNEEQLTIKRRQLIGLLPQEMPAVAIQNTNVIEGATTVADTVKRVFPEMLTKFSKTKARTIDGDKDSGSD